jgi:O-succinylbenzoic acid--CoA ligase
VVASYGMTECCSQIATARPGSSELILLPHVDARTEVDGRLAIRSDALLTGYALFDDDVAAFVDPKVEGWFITEDRVELDGRTVRVKGRVGELIKIGGESVDLVRLDRILGEITPDAALAPADDPRLGCVIHLFVAAGDAEAIAEAFNARVHPFERARRVHRVESIPRSALDKLLRKQLAESLS